jgi:hypothetical protein
MLLSYRLTLSCLLSCAFNHHLHRAVLYADSEIVKRIILAATSTLPLNKNLNAIGGNSETVDRLDYLFHFRLPLKSSSLAKLARRDFNGSKGCGVNCRYNMTSTDDDAQLSGRSNGKSGLPHAIGSPSFSKERNLNNKVASDPLFSRKPQGQRGDNIGLVKYRMRRN